MKYLLLTEFVARLRDDFPEGYPLPWDFETGPKVFINPVALPSFTHKRAKHLAARVMAEALAEEYAPPLAPCHCGAEAKYQDGKHCLRCAWVKNLPNIL